MLLNDHLEFVIGAEFRRLQTQGLATDPTGIELIAGRVWYNTTTNEYKGYDGTQVVVLSGGGGGTDDQTSAEVNSTGISGLSDGTVASQLGELVTLIQNSAGNIVGSAATFAGLPSTDSDGSALDTGDIAYLTAVDGANSRGQYRWNGSAWVLTLPLDALTNATDTAPGIVELATTVEAAAGTDTTRAVTAAGLEAHADGRTFSAQFGDGTTGPFVIAHGLGTSDILWQVYDSTGIVDIDGTTDATNLTFTPISAVASNAYTVRAFRV